MLTNARFLTRPAAGVDRRHRAAGRGFGWVCCRRRAIVPQVPRWSRRCRRALAAGAPAAIRATAGRPELPALAADEPLVNLCNTAPWRHQRQMVVIHDAAAVANPRNYGFAFRHWYRVMLDSVMHRARVVTTVSRFSAD